MCLLPVCALNVAIVPEKMELGCQIRGIEIDLRYHFKERYDITIDFP